MSTWGCFFQSSIILTDSGEKFRNMHLYYISSSILSLINSASWDLKLWIFTISFSLSFPSFLPLFSFLLPCIFILSSLSFFLEHWLLSLGTAFVQPGYITPGSLLSAPPWNTIQLCFPSNLTLQKWQGSWRVGEPGMREDGDKRTCLAESQAPQQ